MAPRPNREPGRPDARNVPERAAAAGRDQLHDDAEHQRLLDAAGRGDDEARQSLTRAHLDWVVNAARERADQGLSVEDLFQEGTIGLMEAIERFRSTGRQDFEAYAREQLASRMDAALGDEERAVRDSELLVQAAEDYQRAEIAVRRQLGRLPTDAELAQKLEWTVERTAEIRQIVEEARRRHDEELLQFLEPGDIDVESLPEDDSEGNGR
jgi:RNA polymerase sigma factor (sigma-70 family)